MQACGERPYGHEPSESFGYDPECNNDAATFGVSPDECVSNVYQRIYGDHRLDDLANSIASATFEVINEGKVRTADMGGGSSEQVSNIFVD